MDPERWPPVLRIAWTVKLWLLRFILVVSSAIFTLLVLVQVIARYIFNESIFGIEELSAFAAMWLYFLGSAHGTQQGEHISASLMDVMLPAGSRGHRVIATATDIIAVVLCGWMTVWATDYLLWTAGRGASSLELKIPMAYVHVALPLGLALMTLYFFLELIGNLGARGKAS